ncbi:hypothetical protein [Lentzea terrae]|uniref:hypothetical protein n=1 Tax=Lentzea terrae TaxID=2200761 RepID=UPI000DD4CCDA|nr:hypothetical protein [Lentzea terrae]
MNNEQRVFAFDGKVAELTSSTGANGYLAVRVEKVIARQGRKRFPKVYVYLDAAIRSGDGGEWEFSDRADPEYDDVLAELTASKVDWYGQEFELVWLGPDEAERLRRSVFGYD